MNLSMKKTNAAPNKLRKAPMKYGLYGNAMRLVWSTWKSIRATGQNSSAIHNHPHSPPAKAVKPTALNVAFIPIEL